MLDLRKMTYICVSTAAIALGSAAYAHDTIYAYHPAPIVLDLDGDGIEMVPAAEVKFPIKYYITGFPSTGWPSADDGVLVRDVNGNGLVDSAQELFVSPVADGFTLLGYEEAMDSAHADLRLSAADGELFEQLKIWRVERKDGKLNRNKELEPLSDYGITMLDIRSMPQKLEPRWMDDNRIGFRSRFYRADGSHGEMAYVLLHIYGESQLSHPLGIKHEPQSDSGLPQQKGVGLLESWSMAMESDPVFRTMLERFTQQQDFVDIDAEVEALIFRWAKVDDVEKDARGPHIDGRKLGAMERLLNREFGVARGEPNPIRPRQGILLEKAWRKLVDVMRVRAAAMGPLRHVFTNASYNYRKDKLYLVDNYSTLYGRICSDERMWHSGYAQAVQDVLLRCARELGVIETRIRKDIAQARDNAFLQAAGFQPEGDCY